MNQSRFSFPLLLLVLILVVMVVCPLTFLSTAPQITQQAFDYADRPPSPAELVMLSRSTAPADLGRSSLGMVGWLAVLLVVIAAAIGLLYFLSRVLREWRLTKQRRPSLSRAPIRPIYDVPQLPMARPAHRVPALPDGFDFDGGNHHANN